VEIKNKEGRKNAQLYLNHRSIKEGLAEDFKNKLPEPIQLYFFTSLLGIQLIISASPNVEITNPGRQARGFVNPCYIVQGPVFVGVLFSWISRKYR
jgi:hypothetical protein